jgi:ATP-binding cassette subfamily B protein/subfamily B ATP-binding cassette protein MsbA
MISRLLNDMTVIQNGLRYFIDLIREPVTLILLLSWLFYLNWMLTLSILIVLPLLLKLLKNLSESVAKYSRMGQQQMEKVTQHVKENLDGARVIQSFTLEEYSLSRLIESFNQYFQIRKTMYSRVHLAGPIGEWVAMIVGVGVVLTIAADIQSGRSTFGDFTSYLGALLMLNKPIKAIQDGVVRVQEVRVAASRLFEILDEPLQVQDKGDAVPFPVQFTKIQFHDVYFQYQDQPVLKGINFEVQRGQSVALVGSSGSGKSTLINLLPRFMDVTRGSIRIDSVDVRDISLKSLRQNIALVTQDVYLFSGSISENIQTGNLNADSSKLDLAIQQSGATEFIERLPEKLESLVGERGQLLSGGEKQRLSIARAIFKDAPILIFDEATSNLDAKNEAIILETMKSFIKNKTIFIVAHRISSITHCDLILVLDAGQIVESGSHQELMLKQGHYYRLALKQGLT